MKVIINTDKNITLGENSLGELEASVETGLGHFGPKLTRVEVHLTNGSAGRDTGDDIRCRIEARPEGLNPEFAVDNASSVDGAVAGALTKLRHVLDTTFGKRDTHKGASSMGGVEHR
jgi:hypothetical protein